ncbi:DUF6000 family protein [Streptomyces sp. NPDC048462]|uniref:DUF6000 family protein n=1 Tax=Streptomyces sp. NPDC048462 TaxID=3365555 RepID=UPI00371E5EAA
MDGMTILSALNAAAYRYVLVDGRHLELLHGNLQRQEPAARTAFLRELIADSGRADDEEFTTLLGISAGWRERLVAAWMAGIGGRTRQRRRIGELLIDSSQTFAGQGHCFALACFATPADARILSDYLDTYLPRRDLTYDQDWAMGALLDIDTQLGSDYAGRFTAPDGPWWRWTHDTSPGHLESLGARIGELRALVENARQARPAVTDIRAVRLPAGWTPASPADSAAIEAGLAAALAADPDERLPLTDRPVTVVAHCGRRDHALLEITGDPNRWVLSRPLDPWHPGHDTRLDFVFFASTETAAAGLREHPR